MDMAAGTIQCPDCGLLCDIPTLEDLHATAEDGTLRLRETPSHAEPQRVADLARTFSRRTDKDLRASHNDLAAVGPGPLSDEFAIPLAGPSVPNSPRSKPKYDPETGELIRPLDLIKPPAEHEAQAHIPVAKRAIDYASGENARKTSIPHVMVELLMPVNVVVMLFTFFFYFAFLVLEGFAGPILVYGGAHPKTISLFAAFFLMAHYVNTIDDIGPNELDDLPRPLRGVSWGEDLWGSFIHFMIAAMLCFGPAMLIQSWLEPQSAFPFTILLLGAGFLLFPVALLTSVTSGTLNNLRPDRLIATARAMGRSYITALLLWAIALPLFALSLIDRFLVPEFIRAEHHSIDTFLNLPSVRLPAIGLSIYFMHLACWHLGLTYRRYHAHFPWVHQRHISTRASEEARRAAEVRALRRRTDRQNAGHQ